MEEDISPASLNVTEESSSKFKLVDRAKAKDVRLKAMEKQSETKKGS